MKKLIFLFILFSVDASAKTYHVRTGGNNSNNGLSYANAFLTIQTATNLVIAGDSVWVYDGFYKGFDHFYKNSGTAGNEIVYMAKGSNVVINQTCGRGYDGLNIEGNNYIEVNGFKVDKIFDPVGSGEDGIRAVLANHITIRNCEVDSCYRGILTGFTDDFLAENNICKRSFGEHGIYVSNNSDRVIVRNNICWGNKAAGVQLNPDLSSGTPGISIDVKLYNNICYNNRIGFNLQGIYNSLIYNNLIYNNGLTGGGNGITFFLGDAATGCNNVKFYNNTVFVPSASQWCILGIESDSLFVKNNILLSASNKGCLNIETTCTNYFSDYNLLNDKMTTNDGVSYINFSTWQGMGNDPNSILVTNNASVFMNLAANDYHLAPASQAIDKGSNVVSTVVVNDIDGNTRPMGAKYDIGCYEKLGATGLKDIYADQVFKVKQEGSIISFDNLEEEHIVELFDMSGKSLGKSKTFNVREYAAGIYVYHIISSKTNTRAGMGKVFISGNYNNK